MSPELGTEMTDQFGGTDWAELAATNGAPAPAEVFKAHYRLTFLDAEGNVVVNEIRSTRALPNPGAKAGLKEYFQGLGCEMLSMQVLNVIPSEMPEEEPVVPEAPKPLAVSNAPPVSPAPPPRRQIGWQPRLVINKILVALAIGVPSVTAVSGGYQPAAAQFIVDHEPLECCPDEDGWMPLDANNERA
jgi:hypothetical protein